VRDKKGLFSFLNLDSIVENLSGFVEKKIEIYKIEFKEEAARAGAKLVVMFVLALALFMAVFFFTVGLAAILNNVLESTYLGFLIMAGFYLLIVVVFIFLNRSFGINKSLEEMFLKIFKGKEENGN
jgi:uncharacterized membrane protein YqjE